MSRLVMPLSASRGAFRALVVGGIAGLLLVLAGATPAQAATPNVRVVGPGGLSTDPHLAVDPADSNKLLSSFSEMNGAVAAAISLDAGTTWLTTPAIPPTPNQTPTARDFIATVAIDRTGIQYLAFMLADQP
jgi:hypothetical protein